MDEGALLLATGAVLLGVAAFMGFAQARTTRGSAAEGKWRLVHSGGTAGGVQLLALSGVWPRLAGQSPIAGLTAIALALSTWLFFIGPLLKALAQKRIGNVFLWGGALAAVPAYAGLIALAVIAL